MESIDECKTSKKLAVTDVQTTSIGAALARLREEMVGLMDQDAGLMRQLLILNEKVEEQKANNICQMSKESLDSQDSLYQENGETDEYLMHSNDILYHSDEQTDGSSSDEERFEYSEWSENEAGYSGSDIRNGTYRSNDCLCSRKKLKYSSFSLFLEFETM